MDSKSIWKNGGKCGMQLRISLERVFSFGMSYYQLIRVGGEEGREVILV